MFTGIVQGIGSVTNVSRDGSGIKLELNLGRLESEKIQTGDSISVNGACLTVNSIDSDRACFDVSSETLARGLIGNWKVDDKVNLETALTLQTPIGGHLVSGHIDGTVKLIQRKDNEEFAVLKFEAENSVGKFIAAKGSVAIDGISLTTNTVEDQNKQTHFEVMVVPYTLGNTTLGTLSVNSLAQVEVDQIARYIYRMNECNG